jgi:4-aminobutyrate aminotransferase-like enzyme/Ser/Thr protein kinase RdoA (MazF antagonist)
MNNMSAALSNCFILNLVKQHYGLCGDISDLPSYSDINKLLTCENAKKYVIKISRLAGDDCDIDFENQVMLKLASDSRVLIDTPQVLSPKSVEAHLASRCYIVVHFEGVEWCLRVVSFIPGELWANTSTSALSYFQSLGKALASIDHSLVNFKHANAKRMLSWDLQHAPWVIESCIDELSKSEQFAAIKQLLEKYIQQVQPLTAKLPRQVIHNDANDFNLVVDSIAGKVSGLFDFGDAVYTFRVAELAIAAAYALMKVEHIESALTSLVVAYHKELPLKPIELEALIPLIEMRLAVSLVMSARNSRLQPENDYLRVSQDLAWKLLQKLQQLDIISVTLQLKQQCLEGEENSSVGFTNQALIDYRQKHLSKNLSLAYAEPLKIVRGSGAYLYDDCGNRYLDMVNNVCHVGHCHPKVVAAGQKQMALLNTNTRYLHDNIATFTRNLLSTMPAELSVCMLVNSGSEANELSLRLARNYTSRKGMVVVDGAYHGNSNACIDISPYKFDGRGGKGAPDWVAKTLLPDPFRGKFKGFTTQSGEFYALDIKRAIKELHHNGHAIAGFICESIQGVAGQIIHPNRYLQHAYKIVRDAGGVCIADEVQVGMGRVGSHWWAFQTQQVVPDIVTIGKPLGNGHPLAAVVTTPEIAAAFENGMEYFNTFGGNPVSCAIGNAVIEVVNEEGLLEHAQNVGSYLIDQLNKLKSKFPLIGDVRGIGMFIGVELVKDEQLTPATSETNQVVEYLKQSGILLTTEGPFGNVLKIKPPLAFGIAEADYFLDKLSLSLQQL